MDHAGREHGSELLALLHLCDSLFPVGSFAHSDGLEAATAAGLITNARELRGWLDICLDESIGRSEGPTVLGAWSAFRDRDWHALTRFDQEVTALRPSSGARRASRAMGSRLATTWHTLYPDASLGHVVALGREGAIGPTLPVAFASACASSGVDRRSTVEAFAYNRLAATISSAMRLMPIGQTAAHVLLAAALARVPAVVDAIIARGTGAESFAPAMDIAAMTQQYVHSRLFRS
jgi:urease accessory protein